MFARLAKSVSRALRSAPASPDSARAHAGGTGGAGGAGGTGDAHLRPYQEAVDRFGACFEATLWASRQHQRTRFEVLASECRFEGMSVLDAGCAHAELLVFLGEHSVTPRLYIGVEGVPELADAARESVRSVGVESRIALGDFVADPLVLERAARDAGEADGRADVVVFSGSLNTLKTDAALVVLERAWLLSRRALAFNFLSDRCSAAIRGGDTGPAHRFDTLRVLGWALSRTTQIRYRQDYFPGGHDATIVMLREGD